MIQVSGQWLIDGRFSRLLTLLTESPRLLEPPGEHWHVAGYMIGRNCRIAWKPNGNDILVAVKPHGTGDPLLCLSV